MTLFYDTKITQKAFATFLETTNLITNFDLPKTFKSCSNKLVQPEKLLKLAKVIINLFGKEDDTGDVFILDTENDKLVCFLKYFVLTVIYNLILF